VVVIIGGGIGGLTLALMLHRVGIAARVYEAAPEIRPLGVGINILPPAAAILAALGLEDELTHRAIITREAVFFNRFGQRIHTEPLGRFAGNQWPQISIHRADLHSVLLEAVTTRLGAGAVRTGWRCTRIEQDGTCATAHFEDALTGSELPAESGDAIVGCDGLHSVIRKQLHPAEGEALYSGVNMWRGVSRWPPILSGASMIRAGWFTPGKLVAYPIGTLPDGRQLVNWLAEIATPEHEARDWNRRGELDDFIHVFDDWRFDWLDVPAFLRAAELILEFPMIDQDPLPLWTEGRATLLGDAAHPMYPRGSNGAGQAILDAHVLARCVARHEDVEAALREYEAERLPLTANVVRMSRTNPPDAILREVYLRSGDKPFERIDDVIGRDEIAALLDNYARATAAGPDGPAHRTSDHSTHRT
jgi:5-methylphenazine-1-carboxylate 1-monooxygenase